MINFLSSAPFDIRKEAAFTLGNLCVAPPKNNEQPGIIVVHLVSLIDSGCLPGFLNLIRSADIESARLGLQFLELVSLFMSRFLVLYDFLIFWNNISFFIGFALLLSPSDIITKSNSLEFELLGNLILCYIVALTKRSRDSRPVYVIWNLDIDIPQKDSLSA